MNDLYRIIQRLDELEKSRQLPALFKPKDISPVLNGPYDKTHPTSGYFVGSESKEFKESNMNELDIQYQDYKEMMPAAFLSRYKITKEQWYEQYKNILPKIHEGNATGYGVETNDSGAEETPDGVSPDTQSFLDESKESTTEDVLSTVKKKLGDYLQDVADAVKQDSDLKDNKPQTVDQIGPSVKTITTDDGHEIKIHGSEDDGFRITIKNKASNTKFSNLDEAVMAVEMYCSRRNATQLNNDYLDETQ